MEENLNLNEGQESVVDSQNNEPVQANNVEPAEPQQANEQKPSQSPEENAKYAQIRREYEGRLRAETERAKQEARDEYIASQGYEWNGKQIKTEAEYNQAVREKQIYDKYQAQGLPEDVIQQLAKVDQLEKNWQESKQAEQQREETERKKAQQHADLQDFIKTFPDVKAEDIPVEVWQANANGVPLRYAYAEHAYRQTMVAEQKARANANNASGSMGSISGDGAANDSDFISYETYEKNRGNQTWVNKNFDKIMKSRDKW